MKQNYMNLHGGHRRRTAMVVETHVQKLAMIVSIQMQNSAMNVRTIEFIHVVYLRTRLYLRTC